jgi:SAM-dependent methyltransferase
LGFGAGSYLAAAKRAGWDVSGVEVSSGALDQARKEGFSIFEGELHEARYPDNYFDVITAVEVLEHVAKPAELLKEVVRILRPGGVLWATTPHGRGLSFRLLGLKWTAVAPPEHLQLFSIKGMRLLLANAGFHDIKVQTHGFNPAEVVSQPCRTNYKLDGPLNADGDFNRVSSAYEINAALMQNRTGTIIKRILNSALNAVRQGDTLKIVASR